MVGFPTIPGPSYQPLRAPQFNPENWLDAYRQGNADREQTEQKNLLKGVGSDMASGNLLGAASKAYAGGDVKTGIELTKYKHGLDLQNQETQLKLVEFLGRHATAADTPEMQQTWFGIADNIFGTDKVAPLRGVSWEQVIAGFADKKDELERLKIAGEQEKLGAEREQRAMSQQIYRQMGILPPAAAPTYAAPPPSISAAPAMEAPPAAPSAPTAETATLAPPRDLKDAYSRLTEPQKAVAMALAAKGDVAGLAKYVNETVSPPEVTNTIKTNAHRAMQAYENLAPALDDYAKLVETTGAAVLPGQSKDAVIQARRNIQLQLKELYNLGVLNGPDLELMDAMLFNPAVNNPLEVGNAWDAINRTKGSVTRIKDMLRNMRNSYARQIGIAEAPPFATGEAKPKAKDKLEDPLGIR